MMTNNGRRSSEEIQRRSSLQLVQDVGGVPYRIFSVCLGMMYVLSGLRDIFYCQVSLSGSDRIRKRIPLGAYGVMECQTDKHKQLIGERLSRCIRLDACCHTVPHSLRSAHCRLVQHDDPRAIH